MLRINLHTLSAITMAPTTKYTDFEEGEPFTRHDRRYVPIKCKRCERVFDLAEASLRSNKSSRCKRHLDSECTAEETKRQRLATQEAPADPPLVLDTSANEERALKLERDVEKKRASAGIKDILIKRRSCSRSPSHATLRP